MSAEETLRWLDDGPPTEMMPQRRDGSVPDAPFVKNPNQWARLAMGRMLRYAADNGFDKLAWTSGRTQAKRWGELDQIAKVEYLPNPKGDYEVNTYTQEGWDGSDLPVSTESMTLEMIEKKFGTEVSDQIRMGKGVSKSRGGEGRSSSRDKHKSIDVNLEVGGEKKKALYDQVYPNVMKKLVKKMGGVVKREALGSIEGAKVGRTAYQDMHGRRGYEYHIELGDGTRILAGDDGFAGRALEEGRRLGPSAIEFNRYTPDKLKAVYDGTMDISELRLDRLLADYKLEAWTVTIPRGWKKQIKEGLPLFSVPAAGLLGAQASDDQ